MVIVSSQSKLKEKVSEGRGDQLTHVTHFSSHFLPQKKPKTEGGKQQGSDSLWFPRKKKKNLRWKKEQTLGRSRQHRIRFFKKKFARDEKKGKVVAVFFPKWKET